MGVLLDHHLGLVVHGAEGVAEAREHLRNGRSTQYSSLTRPGRTQKGVLESLGSPLPLIYYGDSVHEHYSSGIVFMPVDHHGRLVCRRWLRPGWAPDPLMVGIRSPNGLVGSCTSHSGVLGSIPTREERGKTGKYRVPHGSRSALPSQGPRRAGWRRVGPESASCTARAGRPWRSTCSCGAAVCEGVGNARRSLQQNSVAAKGKGGTVRQKLSVVSKALRCSTWGNDWPRVWAT